jgi:hypothetical protein
MNIYLAIYGHVEEVLRTFMRIQEDATVIPAKITYIDILCA